MLAEEIFAAGFLLAAVGAFPDGAPFDTCLPMFPKHSNTEQRSGPPPFSITISPQIYLPGDSITVTIAAMTEHVIRGVQVRAHRADLNMEDTVGMFVSWPEDKVQPLNCFGQPHNMITHRNNEPRRNITLIWKTPDTNIGAVMFRVTIVEDFRTFWSQMTSSRLKPVDSSSVVMPDIVAAVPNSTFTPIDWSECGKKKGCLLYPRYCSGRDCYAAVTFTKTHDGYTFEMLARAEGYVSVGFSHDTKMGDDQTITCTAQGDRVSVQNGYNHKALYNERMMGLTLRNLETAQHDGTVCCRFTRPENMDVIYMHSQNGPAEVISFDLTVHYYLFLAWGYTYQDSDALQMHKEMPIISDSKIDFGRFDIYRGSVIPYIPKVHACLMVVAWMAMAGLTVVLARYFREGVGAHYCCGARTWFQLHRLASFAVFALTVAGLTLILIHFKGKITEREEALNHAYVGFSVVAAVCAQVVCGMLRPDRVSRFRLFFNIGHRVLGKSAQVLSAATILLAFEWEWVPAVMRDFGLIVCYVWIGVQILAEILLEIWLRCCNRKRMAADINMDDPQPIEKQLEARPDPSNLPIMLYCFISMATGAAGLCMLLLF